MISGSDRIPRSRYFCEKLWSYLLKSGHIWEHTVPAKDIDYQKIVNNACYLQYFDNARIACLKDHGIDWQTWHDNGFNIVLADTEIHFKYPLKAGDSFFVETHIKRISQLRLCFSQTIYTLPANKKVCYANNTIVCISLAKNKPVFPEALGCLLQEG